MHERSPYLVKLTWLRGIAATLVVSSHSIRLSEGDYGEARVANTSFEWFRLFDLGTFGVMLFFALSGATLYFSNKRIGGLNGLGKFYIKRFFRIWPAFVLALVVYILFIPIFKTFYIEPSGNWVESQYLKEWAIGDLLSYLTLSFNLAGNGGLFNNAFWSLPIEFQYYLAFPLILISMRYLSVLGPMLIAAGSYMIHKHSPDMPYLTLVFFLAYTFCFGMVLAYLYEKVTWRLNQYVGYFLFTCSLITCALAENGIINFGNLPILSNPYGWTGVTGLMCIAALLFTRHDLSKHDKIVKPVHYLG